MSRAPLAAALIVALAPSLASAGAFLLGSDTLNNQALNVVTHVKGYPLGANPVGANYVVTVCLNPNTTPVAAEQPVRNAIAELNRLQGMNGNVTAGPGGGQRDFESVMLHELGHCMGLDHNVLGPSELQVGNVTDARLYYTNSRPNVAGFQTNAGADGVRASRDDIRGDDQNVHWFRSGVNDPFADLPAVVDQSNYTVSIASLPVGHLYPEAATSHDPCDPQGGAASTSDLPGRAANTQSIMMPVLCSNNSIRKLAKDDVAQFRIARAGYNGTAGNQDDYTWTMQYVGRVANCDIPISLVDDASTGFAQCNVGFSLPGNGSGDAVLTSMNLIARASVNWFYNPVDTTVGGPVGRIFYSGFE